MHGPPLAGLLLTVLGAAVGGLCLLRMRALAAEERRGAAGDALMGLGMAAMALPADPPGPAAWPPVVFAAVFGAAFVRALLPPRAARHHLHHALGALAMVYMAVAMGVADHGGHGAAAGPPLVTAALLAYYVLYVLHRGLRPVAAGAGVPGAGVPSAAVPAAAAGGGWAARPELGGACRVCLGTGMVAMLLAL